MRAAPWFVLLLLLPLTGGQAAEPPGDLIVLFAPGAAPDLPFSAVPLAVIEGAVIRAAPPGAASVLRAIPGVVDVQRAVPLEFHAAHDANLRLTRAHAAPDGVAPFAVTGRGITVAVVDSGIDGTHPELRGKVKANVRLAQTRFIDTPGDLDGHGTHVAGIVAGEGDADGIARGVAPAANLVGVDISETFNTASALLAYDWLFVEHRTHDIRIVVNAWGRVGAEAFDPNDAVVRAIDRLVGSGVVVLFSASNHGPRPSSLSLEAQNPRVITVGAVDAAATLQSYSSRGPVMARTQSEAWIKPDIVAPGEAIIGVRSLQTAPDASDPDALHRILSGTSQAVPHVAGIVALMLQANASLTPRDVANALRASSIDLGPPGPDDGTGFGLVDARDALHQAHAEPNDRQNPLIVGGIETYDATASLVPTPSAGGLLALTRTERELWTTTFPVKPGADAVLFDLTAAAGLTRVTLTRDGRDEGTWNAQNGAIRGRLDRPTPGVYTLHVRGDTPTPIQLQSHVEVLLQANATRALELDSRYRLPDIPNDHSGTYLVQAQVFLRAHPGLAPMILAGFLWALTLRPPPVDRPMRRLITLAPYSENDPGPHPED